MLVKFIILCLIFIVLGGGYVVYNKPQALPGLGLLNTSLSLPVEVKGIRTDRVGSISAELKSDFDKSITNAQKQIMEIKIGDMANFLGRAKKISEDAKSFQGYIKKEIDNFLNNK